jgi:hypothetical protein
LTAAKKISKKIFSVFIGIGSLFLHQNSKMAHLLNNNALRVKGNQ